MRNKKSAIEKRKIEIDKQLSHLRAQLGKKSRKDFTTDFRYENWLKRSHTLIEELIDEAAILSDPGEYASLPIAVVADEIGLRADQVKRLIRTGEIEATGERAHELVSREELGRLADLGPEELLKQGEQSVEQIFEEAIGRLRAEDEANAGKAYMRIQARETCIGNYALALEIALNLARGRYKEADRAIKFIFRERFDAKSAISSHISKFLSGVCFKSKKIQTEILRLVQQLDEEAAEAVKSGVDANNYQFTAIYITAVVKWALEESFTYALPVGQREELNQLIMNSIFTALYANANAESSLSCRQFVLSAKQRIPQFWEPAILIKELGEG